MTDHTPPTTQQLDGYETAARNAARIGSGIDPSAVLELATEIRRLRAELAKEERLHGDTIDDRDRAQDAADKLAYAVAPETVIGEHTADNSPWDNALDLITPMAEVDKLRQQFAANRAQAWRDLADRADPQRPEISFFGDHGHIVGEWMRQQAEYEERAAAAAVVPAVVETGEAGA